MKEQHKIIIIGAGLSGLYLAWQLRKKNHEVIVLESRSRCGGRILSRKLNTDKNSYVDLGPSWLWPQYQFRLKKLLEDLNLSVFKQYTQGDMLYESATDKIERYNAESAHNQSYRISGGSISLIHKLLSLLPKDCIQLNTQVTSIQQSSISGKALTVQIQTKDKIHYFSADRIILALPPRVMQQTMQFNPELSDEIKTLWSSTPTWMAVHSKIIFIYDRAFWREKNLSGEVFSHCGPLSEIYDGSPENEEYYALTCFIGLSALQRKKLSEDEIKTACLKQLQRLFGDDSQNIKHIFIKDWSVDNRTATPIDIQSAIQHPQFPQQNTLHLWDKKIFLAGTEVAKENGGYLEGALESADKIIAQF